MKLIPIHLRAETALAILWDLLAERPDYANISHREMPNWTAHEHFVNHHPYRTWRLIEVENIPVGAIYLTTQNEIGIGILSAHQRKGYATAAIMMLMTEYGPKKFAANINPANTASIRMFERLGFRHVQNTYVVSE